MNNTVTDDDAVNVALLPSFVEIELIKFAFLVPACHEFSPCLIDQKRSLHDIILDRSLPSYSTPTFQIRKIEVLIREHLIVVFHLRMPCQPSGFSPLVSGLVSFLACHVCPFPCHPCCARLRNRCRLTVLRLNRIVERRMKSWITATMTMQAASSPPRHNDYLPRGDGHILLLSY